MEHTESIVDDHWKYFVRQDLSGIMDRYDDDSILLTNVGTFRGPEGIERFFEDLFEDFSQEGVTIELTQQTVREDIGFLVWNAETTETVYSFVAETFLIPEKSIRFHTFAGDMASKSVR